MTKKRIVFRHYCRMLYKPSLMTEEEARNKFIDSCFNRGYVPLNILINHTDWWEDKPSDYGMVFSYAGYAGKRRARKIGVKQLDLSNLKRSNFFKLKN